MLMGVLMLMSKSRKRFPCFVCGCCAILAGGYFLGFPYLNAIPYLDWLWFCVWLAALPSMFFCIIALGLLATEREVPKFCVGLGLVAFLANIGPMVSFWSAAVTGVVEVRPPSENFLDHDIESQLFLPNQSSWLNVRTVLALDG